MCAQFMIKANRQKVLGFYGAMIAPPLDGFDETLDLRVVPFTPGIVLTARTGTKLLEPMRFSLTPSWSKEAKPKFATYNARIEDIEWKPTWKEPFQKFHCVVPLTSFVEPIYIREFAGNMVAFSSGEEMLSAAGLYNSWRDLQTGEVIDTFALIMQPATPFIESIGHERSPIFLDHSGCEEWLSNENSAPKVLKDFLMDRSIVPELDVSVDRPMAKGWEKRIPKD